MPGMCTCVIVAFANVVQQLRAWNGKIPAKIPRQERILGRCRLLTHAREVPCHRFALKTPKKTVGKQRKRHRFNIGMNGRFTNRKGARLE
jgi:hypothetical protein